MTTIATLGFVPPELQVVCENDPNVNWEQLNVGVMVGVPVLVGVLVMVGVFVAVGVKVGVFVFGGVAVLVTVEVGVFVPVDVDVLVGHGVLVSTSPLPGCAMEREVRNVSTTPWR